MCWRLWVDVKDIVVLRVLAIPSAALSTVPILFVQLLMHELLVVIGVLDK